jgi:hypothetical protein
MQAYRKLRRYTSISVARKYKKRPIHISLSVPSVRVGAAWDRWSVETRILTRSLQAPPLHTQTHTHHHGFVRQVFLGEPASVSVQRSTVVRVTQVFLLSIHRPTNRQAYVISVSMGLYVCVSPFHKHETNFYRAWRCYFIWCHCMFYSFVSFLCFPFNSSLIILSFDAIAYSLSYCQVVKWTLSTIPDKLIL